MLGNKLAKKLSNRPKLSIIYEQARIVWMRCISASNSEYKIMLFTCISCGNCWEGTMMSCCPNYACRRIKITRSDENVQTPTKFDRTFFTDVPKPFITKRISVKDTEITLGELKTRYNFEKYTFFHKPAFSKFPPTQVYDPEYKIIGPIELTVFYNNVIYIK